VSRRSMGMGVLALVAAAGFLIWWMCQRPALQTVRLRDGARISLGAVTYGKTHRFDPAPPLLRGFRALSDNLPIASEESYDGDSQETVAWLHLRPGPRGTNAAMSECYWQFQDEHGCPFERGNVDTSSHFYAGADQWISVRPPEELTHERSSWIRGYYLDTHQQAFEIHVVSPASAARPRPFVDLKPRSMPLASSQGGFTAVLKAVKWVPDAENSHYGAQIRGVDARYPGAEWTPVSLTAEDRYGKRIESIDPWWRRFMKGDGFQFFGLCRKEPAWKLRAILAREPWSPGEPDHVWEAPERPVSRGYEKTQSLRNGECRLEVSQPSLHTVWRDSGGRERRLIRVGVSVGKPGRECRLVVTHINGVKTSSQSSERSAPDGRELPRYVTDVTRESKGRGWFLLPLAVDTDRVRLRIGEYWVRRAEFVVKPPQIRIEPSDCEGGLCTRSRWVSTPGAVRASRRRPVFSNEGDRHAPAAHPLEAVRGCWRSR
jgi:hypothetical protein